MDSKQIQYILKVAECQNITRAAEQLYLSQPALSHFISKTEEELGAKLFNRGTTPLTLTQAGEQYVKTARMILALEEGLYKNIDDMKKGKGGVITLGLSDMRATYILPLVLPQFKRLYPHITVRTVESSSRSVEQNVKDGVVDIGLIPLFDFDPELSSRMIYDEELVLVSTEDLPHQRGAMRSWVAVEELDGKDFVLLSEPNRIRSAVDTIFLEHGVKPGSIMESSNNMTVYMLATTGMAMGIVPEIVVNLMNPIRVPKIYSLGRGGFHWNVGAIWRPDMVLTPAHEELMRLLKIRSV